MLVFVQDWIADSKSKNIYSLEIENISKDIIDGKTEASFPGMNKKEILLNTKIINSWMNEQKQ